MTMSDGTILDFCGGAWLMLGRAHHLRERRDNQSLHRQADGENHYRWQLCLQE